MNFTLKALLQAQMMGETKFEGSTEHERTIVIGGYCV